MIPLARDSRDTANWHPKAEGNLHSSTLPLPDTDTTEELPYWWLGKVWEGLWGAGGGFSHSRKQRGGRGKVEMLGMSKGVCREKQGLVQGTRG